jgi:O-antigen/teichoic acid export membrane protein
MWLMSFSINKIRSSNVSAYQFFQLSRLAVAIFISILLVKIGFEKIEVSTFELFIFTANLFSFFWVMGIKNASLSFYPSLNIADKKSFYFNSFVILQLLGFVFAIFMYIWLVNGNSENETLSNGIVPWLISAFLLFYAPTVLIEILFILEKKSKELFNYAVGIHLLQLVAVSITAWITKDIISLFIVLFAWTFCKWIFTFWLVLKTKQFDLRIGLVKKLIVFSSPIIMHILLGNGMEFIDGLLVNQFFSPDLFAVFRYGARELPFFVILIAALSSTMIPIAVKDINNASSEIRSRTLKLMHLFFPASILLIFFSPWLFSTFYSAEYLDSALLFNTYLLILASRIIMVEVFVYAKHLNKVLMYVSLGELLINIILSILFMQFWGLTGIAIATVIAFMLSKISLVAFIWINHKIRLTEYVHLPAYFTYTSLLYAGYFISLFFL